MASYTISAPNGKSYTIEGPSGASQEDVQNEVMRQYPAASQTATSGSQPTPPAITPDALLPAAPGPRGEPAKPSRSLAGYAARLGSITAKGVVAGALSAPGELALLGAQGIDWAGRKVINSFDSMQGAQIAPRNEFLKNLNVTGSINQIIPGITPESAAERMAKAGSETAGGMITTGGAGGLSGASLASKAGATALARVGLVSAASKGAGDVVGMVSPTAGAVVEVLGNVLGNRNAAPKLSAAPRLTSTDRYKEAQVLYEKSKQTGVVITGKATNQMVADLRATIGDPDLAANKPAHKALDYLQKHSGDGNTGWIGIDLDKLMKVRSDMRNEAVGGGITQSKESKKVGHEMMNRFDELVATMGPKQLHTSNKPVRGPNGKFGPAAGPDMKAFAEGMELKKQADAAYRQASKAKIVEDMLLKAETLQGGTLAERYRAKMGQLIRSEPKFKQFSKEEQDAIRAYHKGSKTQAVTEILAKLSPARGGILPTAGAALAVGTGGASLPLQAVGGMAHYMSGPQSKAAQYGMMQTILKGQQAPKQPISAYMPSDEAIRAGMFTGARN